MNTAHFIMPPRKRFPWNGFTLVELLVTVAILGILASLLLASLKNVREAGKLVGCANNLRNIGIALQSYAADNNAFFPTAGDVAGTLGTNRYWVDLSQRYLNTFWTSHPYYRGTVFDCPADKLRGVSGGNPLTSFLYVCVFYSNYNYTCAINSAQISAPGNIGIVTDGWGSYCMPYQVVADAEGGTDDYKRLRPRHMGKVNILYCDGHVQCKEAKPGDNLRSLFEVP
ncbi:MAG: DUF1559 domain-containing protein [Verrucomicrobiae bacterium]|nr:DUF1559 domain-containing protein [Verrucomicrobiae bacterium]